MTLKRDSRLCSLFGLRHEDREAPLSHEGQGDLVGRVEVLSALQADRQSLRRHLEFAITEQCVAVYPLQKWKLRTGAGCTDGEQTVRQGQPLFFAAFEDQALGGPSSRPAGYRS